MSVLRGLVLACSGWPMLVCIGGVGVRGVGSVRALRAVVRRSRAGGGSWWLGGLRAAKRCWGERGGYGTPPLGWEILLGRG